MKIHKRMEGSKFSFNYVKKLTFTCATNKPKQYTFMLTQYYKEIKNHAEQKKKKKKKLLWPLFMAPSMGFSCLKASEPLPGDSLLFTTKSPEFLILI